MTIGHFRKSVPNFFGEFLAFSVIRPVENLTTDSMGTPLDNQLFELLNNGDTEKILEREDLNHELNYLVEIKMIAKKDVEILLTKDGLEVLELDLYGEKTINFDLFASFIPIKRLPQRPDLSSAIRSADFFPFLMKAAVLSG